MLTTILASTVRSDSIRFWLFLLILLCPSSEPPTPPLKKKLNRNIFYLAACFIPKHSSLSPNPRRKVYIYSSGSRGSWGPRPALPQDLYKIMQFSGIFGENPLFWATYGLWGQNSTGPPLTKILDPYLLIYVFQILHRFWLDPVLCGKCQQAGIDIFLGRLNQMVLDSVHCCHRTIRVCLNDCPDSGLIRQACSSPRMIDEREWIVFQTTIQACTNETRHPPCFYPQANCCCETCGQKRFSDTSSVWRVRLPHT